MQKNSTLSLLLLDDSEHLAELYEQGLRQITGVHVTTETDGRRAKDLASRQLFDVVVIDAKLDYRGVEFGGLRLADDLRGRYGTYSIIVISQFITKDLLGNYGSDFEFLDKHRRGGVNDFANQIYRSAHTLRQRQFVFVAMPFSGELDELYQQRIKPAITQAGYECIRVDEVPHNRSIHQVIFDLVEKSKLVVFVADLASPNAYYEAGFADALGKEVIVVARDLAELKFDVSNRHTIIYGNRPATLTRQLRDKIMSIRFKTPPGR